jgi:hypothetical protein
LTDSGLVIDRSRALPLSVARPVRRTATAAILWARPAAFAMGGDAAAHWVARLRDYDAMIILEDDVVPTTPEFPHD